MRRSGLKGNQELQVASPTNSEGATEHSEQTT
jgi:hypothetical protein